MTDIHKLIDNDFPNLITCLQRAISFSGAPGEPTDVDPLGLALSAALDDFLKSARDMGFHCKNINNTVGYVEMGQGDKLYGIFCHLDTVPEGDPALWKHAPLGGEIDEGRIYGRGSTDDKGPAVACLFAMKALKDSGTTLNCRIRLVLGLDEETGGFRCIHEYLAHEEVPAFSFSPDANFPLINAEKGILRFTVRRRFSSEPCAGIRLESLKGGTRTNVVPDSATAVLRGDPVLILNSLEKTGIKFSAKCHGDVVNATFTGRSAHAMQPWKGENAIVNALKALNTLNFGPEEVRDCVRKMKAYPGADLYGEAMGVAMSDEVSGKLSNNMAIVDLNSDSCSFSMDIRYPVTANGDEITQTLAKFAKYKMDSVFEAAKHSPPLYVPADTPFIQTLLSAYTAVTGEKGYAKSTGGGTYCRDIPNSVSFGIVFPDEEERAHIIDEHIPMESLRKATHIYAEALNKLNTLQYD